MVPPPPKALLFDIGGVCVQSPFQAILDYEIANGIPPGYVNYSISRTAPNGSWQRIERGEIPLDDSFFSAFKADLEDATRWHEYYQRTTRKTDTGSTQTAEPGHVPPVPHIDAKKMFWTMMKFSRKPDPWMWPALKELRGSGRFVLGALSNAVIFPEGVLDEDGEPFYPGLQHPPSKAGDEVQPKNIREVFDVYVHSAETGIRKPQPEIYEVALERMREVGKKGGMQGLEPGDVLFLDDIGENLKQARRCGMGTLKVELGKAWKAVKELEGLLGMKLLDEGTVPKEAKL